ncbi:MAG: NAD-dependent epimerase/dehydratase family protein [Pseudomonadota bacterium]
MKFEHALVAGGGGFLGANLVKTLLRRGVAVTVFDNWSTGREVNFSNINDSRALTVITGDVSEGLPEVDADIVFNMACPASPPFYQADPLGTIRTCVMGTLNVLDWAHKRDVRVVHASTSEVYGDPLQHPQREDQWGNVNPIGPRACYDEGKRAAEAALFDHRRIHGTDARTMRIFNTYGPHMRPDDGRVVSNFIVQALKGETITIYGDGKQTRSFCYADDLIAGILALGESEKQIDRPVNLGNPDEFTIEELAHTVTELVGSNAGYTYLDMPVDDPVRRQPDISLAKELLDWEPVVPLRNGLKETIAYFKSAIASQT